MGASWPVGNRGRSVKGPLKRNEGEGLRSVARRGKRCDTFVRGTSGRLGALNTRTEFEHTCWDPRDGELCLSRAKRRETVLEARSSSDVQIFGQTWA